MILDSRIEAVRYIMSTMFSVMDFIQPDPLNFIENNLYL